MKKKQKTKRKISPELRKALIARLKKARAVLRARRESSTSQSRSSKTAKPRKPKKAKKPKERDYRFNMEKGFFG